MKKILFIIPGLATGGTNSSLDSMYNQIKNDYIINVLAISHQPHDHVYSFEKVLLPQDRFLSYFYSNFGNQKGISKVLAFFVKSLQAIFFFFKLDIISKYSKKIIKRLEDNESFDFIVGFQEGYATSFASLFKNENKICWVHCDYDNWMPKGKSELSLYSKYKKIVCVSEYTASVFRKRYPSLSDKTIAVHNIVNTDKITRLAESSIDDPRFIKKDYILLTVGRFHQVKRFQEIPVVASKLKASGLDFMWYILGPGDKEELDAFNQNLKRFKMEDFVKWLGGKSNPYPYYRASDLFVCLSESEACPMVFIEAQLLKLPVVTTDFPSSHEFINNDNGIITTLDKLANAILLISNHPNNFDFKASKKMCSENVSKIKELFN